MQIAPPEYQEQLVRGLAHRMNNILTLFHGYVGVLMADSGLDKETRDGLAKIKDGAIAATELIDRTHSLVRQSTVVLRELNLADLVRTLRPVLEPAADSKTKLEIVAPDDLPVVWADTGRVKTAILELSRNAFEALHGRKGTVRIELSEEVPAGQNATPTGHAAQSIRWVALSVIDDGPGVPPEMEERIFQPFFSGKKKKNATGLGLNVTMGVVQQLGGVLRYGREDGKTRFQILLPARRDHLEGTTTSAAANPPAIAAARTRLADAEGRGPGASHSPAPQTDSKAA